MSMIAGIRVNQPAAALVVFMGTGNFRRSLGVATISGVFGMVLAQPACACDHNAVLYASFGKRRRRQQRHDHAQADNCCKQSLSG